MISETQYEELIRTIYNSINQNKKYRDKITEEFDEATFNFYDGKVIALESVISYIQLKFEQ